MTNQSTQTTAVRRAIARLHMNVTAASRPAGLDAAVAPIGSGPATEGGTGGSAVPRDASARRSKSATTCSASAVRPRSNR